jgi:hypothetical protein
MPWDTFMSIHRWSGLVVGQSTAGEAADVRQTWLTLIGRLIAELGTQGDHAICARGSTVYVAFESNNDAQWLAAAVGATAPPVHASGWSAQFVFRMDAALYCEVSSKLDQRLCRW